MPAQSQNVVTLTSRQIINTVDKIGELKAQIKRLSKEADFLIDVLKEMGDDDYLGKLYAVTVKTTERQSLDTAIAKGFLTPAEIIAATKSSIVTTATVKAA